MIAILNYGLGNINAFANVYKKQDISLKVVTTAKELEGATRIILPGVGSFDQAMILFDKSGMRSTVDKMVLMDGIPLIGICVGMQMLAHSSEEGILPGLGYINGVVRKFDQSKQIPKLNLPHMGWNDIRPTNGSILFNDLIKNPLFYFLHSYYFDCNDTANSIATADYGEEFTCAVNHKNIYGVQFHPEKSAAIGEQILQNFLNI